MEKQIKKEAEELFKQIGIDAKVEVEKEDDTFKLLVDADENALLIGKHGNTLTSLESVISLMFAKKQGEYKRIILEVGDYRKEREEYLKNLATRLKEEVESTGIEKTIRGLKPWERRLIHILLQEDENVTTESQDEDRDRVLVIKKK